MTISYNEVYGQDKPIIEEIRGADLNLYHG